MKTITSEAITSQSIIVLLFLHSICAFDHINSRWTHKPAPIWMESEELSLRPCSAHELIGQRTINQARGFKLKGYK